MTRGDISSEDLQRSLDDIFTPEELIGRAKDHQLGGCDRDSLIGLASYHDAHPEELSRIANSGFLQAASDFYLTSEVDFDAVSVYAGLAADELGADAEYLGEHLDHRTVRAMHVSELAVAENKEWISVGKGVTAFGTGALAVGAVTKFGLAVMGGPAIAVVGGIAWAYNSAAKKQKEKIIDTFWKTKQAYESLEHAASAVDERISREYDVMRTILDPMYKK